MAGGVWQATLPTLAGMVLAIGGLFSLARLERNARRALGRLADQIATRIRTKSMRNTSLQSTSRRNPVLI